MGTNSSKSPVVGDNTVKPNTMKAFKQRLPVSFQLNEHKINPLRIGMMMGGALLIGGVFGALSEVSRVVPKKKFILDPAAPCMESMEPTLVEIFVKHIEGFYRLVEDRKTDNYKYHTQKAIEYSEAIFVIETQIRTRDVKPDPELYSTAATFYNMATSHLRKLETLAHHSIVKGINETNNAIVRLILIHTNNIRVLVQN